MKLTKLPRSFIIYSNFVQWDWAPHAGDCPVYADRKLLYIWDCFAVIMHKVLLDQTQKPDHSYQRTYSDWRTHIHTIKAHIRHQIRTVCRFLAVNERLPLYFIRSFAKCAGEEVADDCRRCFRRPTLQEPKVRNPCQLHSMFVYKQLCMWVCVLCAMWPA